MDGNINEKANYLLYKVPFYLFQHAYNSALGGKGHLKN